MRRHATMATMGLAFVLPLAVSVIAVAQPKPAAKKGADAGAAEVAATAGGNADAGAKVANAPVGLATTSPAATPTAGAGPAASAASATSATTSSMDGPQYAVRLRDLEARVDELKDQIRRSHTRLSLLSDTIMSGGAAGARAEVVLQNEMSSAFRLARALVVMDGAVQYNRQDDTGALADQKEIPVFSGSVAPGDHTLVVLLNFQGNGYGVFTYLRGYKFEVKSTHAFTIAEGKTITVNAIALERGGVTTPLEQRPAIDWREKANSIGSSMSATPGGAVPLAAPAKASGSVNVGGKQP